MAYESNVFLYGKWPRPGARLSRPRCLCQNFAEEPANASKLETSKATQMIYFCTEFPIYKNIKTFSVSKVAGQVKGADDGTFWKVWSLLSWFDHLCWCLNGEPSGQTRNPGQRCRSVNFLQSLDFLSLLFWALVQVQNNSPTNDDVLNLCCRFYISSPRWRWRFGQKLQDFRHFCVTNLQELHILVHGLICMLKRNKDLKFMRVTFSRL